MWQRANHTAVDPLKMVGENPHFTYGTEDPLKADDRALLAGSASPQNAAFCDSLLSRRQLALSQQVGLVGSEFVEAEFVGRLSEMLGEVGHDRR